MFIVRTKAQEVAQFGFNLLESAKTAASYIKRCNCEGFIAEVEDECSTKGRLIEKWSGSFNDLQYDIQHGNKVRPEIWANLGTELQCLEMCEKAHKKGVEAHAEHIVGELWVTIHSYFPE